MFPLIDTHAHLDMAPFAKDRSEVIAIARDSGVSIIITVGIDLESSRAAIKLAEDHHEVLATVGFHPHEANRMRETDLTSLAELAHKPRVVAIGEIGLDYYRSKVPPATQLQALQWQLALADRLDLPVIIHCRQAEKDMLPLLHDWSDAHNGRSERPLGIIHCFSGNIEVARQYLAMGFFISVGAYIGYPSSKPLRSVIREIPQNRLLVETDCPFLPPQKHRGQRNEPAYLPLTVTALADIREVSSEIIAQETTRNARNLFRLPDSA
ncbi:MAG: TatD family hydrolase [Dehalococcoidales bacterium]|nr:TatD family hydrolase [Dehalococcoidales bacterium]